MAITIYKAVVNEEQWDQLWDLIDTQGARYEMPAGLNGVVRAHLRLRNDTSRPHIMWDSLEGSKQLYGFEGMCKAIKVAVMNHSLTGDTPNV